LLHLRDARRVAVGPQSEDLACGHEHAVVLLPEAERRFADYFEDRVIVSDVGLRRLEQHPVRVEYHQVKPPAHA